MGAAPLLKDAQGGLDDDRLGHMGDDALHGRSLPAVLSVMPLQASSWSNQLASNCESESLWSRRFTLRLRQRVDHHHAAIVPIYDAQETRARTALGSAACGRGIHP